MCDKNKVRILEIVPAMNVDSGVASFAMNYLRKLDHDKYTVDFVFFVMHESPYYDEIREFGGNAYLLPALTPSLSKHMAECDRILVAGKYDIVHNNALTKSLPLVWCAKKHGVPVRILHSHNASLGDSKWKVLRSRIILSRLKRLSTDYFACSDAAGKCYFGSQPYLLVPNIIDGEMFRFDSAFRNSVRKEMGVENKTVVCTVGRLVAQKNPYFALDVIKTLSQKYRNLVYWWVGTGDLENEVKAYARRQGIDHIVSFLGARTDMPALYHAADIFFLPSLFEGLPVTGVETQAIGLPAVVSDTVTKEMVYTDLIEYVPLNAKTDVWAEAFEKQMMRIPDRRSYTRELENSVFSSLHAGEKLAEYYDKLLTETNR